MDVREALHHPSFLGGCICIKAVMEGLVNCVTNMYVGCWLAYVLVFTVVFTSYTLWRARIVAREGQTKNRGRTHTQPTRIRNIVVGAASARARTHLVCEIYYIVN